MKNRLRCKAIATVFMGILFLALSPHPASAQWESCPFGEVDEAHPGTCGRYIDTDTDGICDRSQPAPEERPPDVVTETQEATLQPEAQAKGNVPQTSITFIESPEETPTIPFDRYHTIPISIAMVLLFVASEYLVASGRLQLLTVKYFWNAALAVSFLVTSVTAIPSLFPQYRYGISHIWWHTEAGLVMIWIGLYHTAKRISFYTRCLPVGKKKKCD